MGWCGDGLYDGDGTQALHYDFLQQAKCATEDEIFDNDWLGKKTLIPEDRIPIFEKNIDLVLKKMPYKKFWNEDIALEWQMLLALFVDNKLKVPKIIRDKGIEATEFLCGPDASEFNNPSNRRRKLRSFIEKAKKLKVKRKTND
jgi:hypothetical protein